jgi:heat shock protein HslJ
MKLFLFAFCICFSCACKNGKQSTSLRGATGNTFSLNGTWELSDIAGLRTPLDSLYPGPKPQIRFDAASSQVSGNTSCNSFGGPVTLDGGNLSFDQPLVLTKMFCPGEGESTFLESLKKIQSWSIRDEVKLVLLAGDIQVMRFTRVQ